MTPHDQTRAGPPERGSPAPLPDHRPVAGRGPGREREASHPPDDLPAGRYATERSTLERQLRQQGLSGREMKAEQKQVASRRFNRVGRNTLWQADLKYGPYLPDPAHPGHKLRTYLVAIVDEDRKTTRRNP